MTQPATMRAIIHAEYGEADVLAYGSAPVPTPEAHDVLVRVRAAALNPADVFAMRGRPGVVRLSSGLRRPRHRVRGTDVAGTVEAVGSAVTRWKTGDDVFGSGRGSLADYTLASEDHLARMPEAISFEAAAATPLAGLAALQGLRLRPPGPGSRVLIIGASGGIGSFAVQMAAAAGAEVTGVCSSHNVDLVKALGAAHVLDYTKESVVGTQERFDLIFDNVGAHRMLALAPLTTETGLLVVNSGAEGPDGGALARVIKATWHGKVMHRRITAFYSSPAAADLDQLAEMLVSGTIVPSLDTMFTVDHAADAMARVASRHARGKVVVSVP